MIDREFEHNGWKWIYTIPSIGHDIDLHWTDVNIKYAVRHDRPALLQVENVSDEELIEVKRLIYTIER